MSSSAPSSPATGQTRPVGALSRDSARGLEGAEAPRSLVHLAVAAILASSAIGAAVVTTAQASLGWGVAAVLLAALTSIRALSAGSTFRRPGVFLPFSFIALWAVGYGLASLAWQHPSADMMARNGAQLRPGSLPSGLAIAAVGLLLWTAGYAVLHLRLVRTAIAALRQWSTSGVVGQGRAEYSVSRIVTVYAVGLAARFALLALGRYSYITLDLQGAISQSSPINAALGQLEFLSTVGLLLLAYICFQTGTTSAKWLLFAAVLLEIPFGLLSGMKSYILLRLLGVAITYVLVRRRVPVFASIGLLGVFAVLVPFTEAYRSEVRDVGGTTVGAADAVELIPALLGSTLSELSLGDVLSGPSDFVTKRLRFVDEVAIVRQRAPSEIAYVPATDTVLEASTVLIPRALWADKPLYTTGLQHAAQILESAGDDRQRSFADLRRRCVLQGRMGGSRSPHGAAWRTDGRNEHGVEPSTSSRRHPDVHSGMDRAREHRGFTVAPRRWTHSIFARDRRRYAVGVKCATWRKGQEKRRTGRRQWVAGVTRK